MVSPRSSSNNRRRQRQPQRQPQTQPRSSTRNHSRETNTDDDLSTDYSGEVDGSVVSSENGRSTSEEEEEEEEEEEDTDPLDDEENIFSSEDDLEPVVKGKLLLPLSEGEDEGAATEGDSLLSKSANSEVEDPLSRLLRGDKTLTRFEIDADCIKIWKKTMGLEDIIAQVAKHPFVKEVAVDFDNVAVDLYEVILNLVVMSEHLEGLELTRARLNRASANVVGIGLAKNKNTIRRIKMKGCTFIGSGLAVLFLGVQHMPKLTHLHVEDCGLGGFASEIVAASLPLLDSLQSLSLVKTQIPAEGMRFLFECLIRSKSIVELDLSQNEFDVQIIGWLVDCLKQKSSKLTSLALTDCWLDQPCLDKLCRGLEKHSTLQALRLSENPFGDQGAGPLVNLVTVNHRIQTLNIKGCNVTKRNLAQLRDALRYNNSFLKNVFSTDVSLAILDSVGLMEKGARSFRR